ncbi:ABC transporter permease subunit [Lagierella sp.]|uniref:ABC transporter permease n=1 Tax=Lagierella sp. TaxID=2849657 RepID=UPI00263457E4|nr:ABC transporter permease subunit [Lagierella sp.]
MINYKKLFGHLCLIVAWIIAYYLLNNPIILPSIWDIVKRIFELIYSGEILSPLLVSLMRIVVAILLSITVGGVLSYLSYIYDIRDVFYPLFSLVKSTPVVSLVLIILFFSNKSYLSTIIIFLIITPIVYENILNGLDNIHVSRIELAKVYNLNSYRKFRYLHLPIIVEKILFSMVIAIGIAIKAAITSEVIGGSSTGIGNLLYLSKISFEMVDLLSITVIIVVVSYVLEEAFRILLKKWKKIDD